MHGRVFELLLAQRYVEDFRLPLEWETPSKISLELPFEQRNAFFAAALVPDGVLDSFLQCRPVHEIQAQ